MRISQLNLQGHGAWPDLHLSELSGQLNLFCAGPRGGKSTLARLIGHLLYGKADSPWRQPFGQSALPADGVVTLQSAAGTYVLRRRRESGKTSALTVAAPDGAAVNSQTVQSLLGDLSPRLAAQLFAVDFAESPRAEWLLSDPFAREFTANLRANAQPKEIEKSLDRQRVDELVQQHQAIARQLEEQVQVGRREAIQLEQQSAELDQSLTEKRQQVEQLQSSLRATDTRLAELAARLRYCSLESTAVGHDHQAAEQHRRQLGELDNQIAHCRQTLADLQPRAVALQTELAQSGADGSADSVTCLADGRTTLGVVERLLDDLDAEVAQLARANESSRPVGADAHARFTPLTDLLRQQLYTLCGQWSEQERRTDRQQLLAETRQLSRAQADMGEWLEQSLARRESLVQQAQVASHPVLLSPQPPVAERCRCEHHQQAANSPIDWNSPQEIEQLQGEQTELQHQRTKLLDKLDVLGGEISQIESRWKQLQQERAGLIGSATIESKRAELHRLESIIQQAMAAKVHDPVRTARKEWRASDVLAQLTDGQLLQIRLTRQEAVATIVDSDRRILAPEQLTPAQRDQLYVALTLALISSYANRGINLPLILDEPFLRLDAAATAVMAGVLEEFARDEHQLLVFTEDFRARRTLESLSCRVFDLEESRQSEQTSGLRLAPEHAHGDLEAVFYLSAASSMDAFPVLGSDTGQVFVRMGIHSVGELLAADPKQIADVLDRSDIHAETVSLWQSHMSLLCHVQELSLNDAQVLTACGIASPVELREANGDELFSAVESFLASDHGHRLVTDVERYTRARIDDWIYAAGGVRSMPLETATR